MTMVNSSVIPWYSPMHLDTAFYSEKIDNILSSVVSNVSKYQSEFNSFIIIHIDKLLDGVIVHVSIVEESN